MRSGGRRSRATALADLRAWAGEHPGAGGFLIVLPVFALVAAAMAFVATTGRASETQGVVTALHMGESQQGSYTQAYVHTPLGDFGSGLPRRSSCRVGSHVRVVVTRDVLGVHQAVSLLSPCVSGP